MMINKLVDYIRDNKLKIKYVDNSLDIVNYDSILEVKSEQITVTKDKKIIKIKGNSLKLNKLLDNEILINGIINKIEM